MTCAEHYFENLLVYEKDCRDNINKNNISEIEQTTIEMCAQYVIWTLFDGREDFDRFQKTKRELYKGKLHTDEYKCLTCKRRAEGCLFEKCWDNDYSEYIESNKQ